MLLQTNTFHEICAYLLMMGFTNETTGASPLTRFENDRFRVVIGNDRIEVHECCYEEERGSYWNLLAKVEVRFLMSMDQFIALMDMLKVIPYAAMLGKLADQSGLSDKRALYHIREALKRSA